jgi:hypothetical protein
MREGERERERDLSKSLSEGGALLFGRASTFVQVFCADVPDVGIEMANIQISTPNNLSTPRACVHALTPVRKHAFSAGGGRWREKERREERGERGENIYIYICIYYICMYIYMYVYIYVYICRYIYI